MDLSALQSERVEVADDLWAVNAFFEEKGWTDGLPIIPPTEERVGQMIAAVKRDPQDVIGVVPPRWAPATVEKIAINAVMAGCLPQYMPVLIAAAEALTDPKLNLYALQATTGGPAIMLIVNGPIRKQLNINGGSNVLGEGWRANATIGRCIRLIQRNIGGSYPGTTCKATLGWPANTVSALRKTKKRARGNRFTSSAALPPTRVPLRLSAPIAAFAPRISTAQRAKDTHQFRSPNGRTFGPGSGHGDLSGTCEDIAGDGFSKADVQKFLWQRAGHRMSEVPEETFNQRVKRRPDLKLTRESVIPVTDKPEDIIVVVAGGDGSQSQYIHVWGQSTPEGGSTRSVTKAVQI